VIPEFPPPRPSGDLLVYRLRLQQIAMRLESCGLRLRVTAAEKQTWTPPQGQPALPSQRRVRRPPGVERG
jgi:hypothetical protein